MKNNVIGEFQRKIRIFGSDPLTLPDPLFFYADDLNKNHLFFVDNWRLNC